MDIEKIINATEEEIELLAAKEKEEEEKDVHQLLMNKAYKDEGERSKADGSGWCYNRMLKEATELERFSVVLGNLNYQVENGGFSQWVDNGYCTSYSDLEDALTAVKTETTAKVYDMLSEVGRYLSDEVLDGTMISQGCGGHYYDDEKLGDCTETCYECGGSCEVENQNYDWDAEENEEESMVECPECMGEGEVDCQPEAPDLGHLDTAFYKINDQLLIDIKSYIVSKQSNEGSNG